MTAKGDPMDGQRRLAAEGGLGPGTTVRFSRTFTAEDVEAFGHLTRDYNPVHYEPRFWGAKGFRGPIAHGLLVASMLCEAGGQWAWLASEMDLRFRRPVYFGDRITCEMTIESVADNGFARARMVYTNDAGEVVLEAGLGGFLPRAEEGAILAEMLDEGDPTNPLT